MIFFFLGLIATLSVFSLIRMPELNYNGGKERLIKLVIIHIELISLLIIALRLYLM